jgi:CheY-like chemotaxis protein
MNDDSVLVYLADDDEDDRLIFSEALTEIKTHTITLLTTVDGNQLISSLNERVSLPDVVFLDLNMPNKNGKEALLQIRSNPRLSPLPVVVYSTSTSDIDVDEAWKAGASMYVEKPYSVKHLVYVLDKVINTDWNKFKGKLPRNKFFLSSRVDENDNMIN